MLCYACSTYQETCSRDLRQQAPSYYIYQEEKYAIRYIIRYIIIDLIEE
jgi:hypothetical protein